MEHLVSRRGLHVQMVGICTALCLFFVACGGGTVENSSSGTGKNTTGSSSSTGNCTPGTMVINGITTKQFCGAAKAQATYQGQTFTWVGGECFSSQGFLGVNVGHEVLDPTNSAAGNNLKKQYDYFGAEAQASAAGAYQGLVAGYYHGQGIDATGTLTFTSNLQGGSFTGNTVIGGVAVTASWTCS